MPSKPKEPISGTISLGKIAFSHHSRMLGFILSRTNPRISSRAASSSFESRASMFKRSRGSGYQASGGLDPVCVVVILPPLSRRLLHDHGDALPDADAHGRQSELDLRPALHLVQEGGQDAGPGATYGVSQGDGPAVRVQPLVLRIHAPLVKHREHLSSEGLV